MSGSKQHGPSDSRRRRPSRSALAAFACAVACSLVACNLVVGDAFDVKAANEASSMQEGEAGGSLSEASSGDEPSDEPIDAAHDVQPSGRITFVQAASTNTFNTPAISISTTLSAVKQGHTLIVALQTSSTKMTVTIGQQKCSPIIVAGPGNTKLALYSALNVVDGDITINVEFDSATGALLMVHEYSGITGPATSNGKWGTGTALDTGDVEVTGGNQLLFAYARCNTGVSTTPSPDFTVRQTEQGNLSEDRVVSSPGMYAATLTAAGDTGGGEWTAVLAAFNGVGQ
ncbi:hypothetical protein AKJ09_10362 [Labilithrix luteola]|uniref:Lipoprotein n=1 Tax=Labilithrix luteola TaxID=1391654 RepID=A0A0K1QD66_9BACT|nr:hypothetical protein [Labilithrix luteola]AKV03699.1 hypothetical protein AKJ09_10362 [Labilithrix luteola]